MEITRRIGMILVEEGYLDAQQQNQVLKLQQSRQGSGEYKPFGQICVELNYLTHEELQRVLRKHNKRILLGELLVNLGYLQPEQVMQALTQQQKRPLKLGEILLAVKWINEQQLAEALSLQLNVPRMIPSLDIADHDLLEKIPLSELKKYQVLPIHQIGDQISVVMADPQNADALKALEGLFGCKVAPAIAAPGDLQRTLQEYEKLMSLPGLGPVSASASIQVEERNRGQQTDTPAPTTPAAEQATVPAPATAPAAPAASASDQGSQVVQFLIKNALKDRASDIHIEPQEKHIAIRYRIDGVLHHKTDLPSDLGPLLFARLKTLCELDPGKQGHQRHQVETTLNETRLKLQIATYPSLWGETMVLHVQAKDSASEDRLLSLERTGFSPLALQRYQDLLQQPGGLVILTGPARAGKTTSLYASIHYLNAQNRAIVTAENPVEMLVPGTIQGAYDPESGESFSEQVYNLHHLDPDVLMVSELDSAETLNAVVEIASSGAKVLTTYTAFDATGALLRLNRMGLENYLIAASQVAVLSQRLVRRLCNACKSPDTPTQAIFNRLGLVNVTPADPYTYYKAVGCEACGQRGYVGQMAIHELLQVNEAIREAVLNHKPAATIRGIARTEARLVSMAEDGLYKAMEGLTSLDEVLRVAFVNEYDAQTPWDAEEIHAICEGQQQEFL
ncbi:MAG: Flp pilus assembly complex ATPase component TadA [Candidatus Sericytochromatia bacterium]|nr:Flp pilus assembly complex ATPase component TadA [Candidatus Sericytochromatia bacterium]